mgnify:CR=1 FL=1
MYLKRWEQVLNGNFQLKEREKEEDNYPLNSFIFFSDVCISKFKKSKLDKTSFYIWGEVGRGKTLITKSFINQLKQSKAIFHYIDFMQNIHNELADLSGKSNPIDFIAKSLSKKYQIIFIDEFQVEDVADAMIISLIGVGELLTYDHVELNQDSFIVALRKKQDELGLTYAPNQK